MPGVKSDKDQTYWSITRHRVAGGGDRGRSHPARTCHPVPFAFRKPNRPLDVVAQHAPTLGRVRLDPAPAAQPKICALDEAIQRGRQLGAALRPDELERDVVAVEDRVGRAQDAGARMTLERVDPGLVWSAVHAKADEDAIARTFRLERGIADTHDRHYDSTPWTRRGRWSAMLRPIPHARDGRDARALRPARSA